MDSIIAGISDFAETLGIEACIEFASNLLVPERRIREYCYENKCGNFSNHYMCPPYIGSVEQIKGQFAGFERGVLLQYTQPLDVRNDKVGVEKTKVDFHRGVLSLEDFLGEQGVTQLWGMIGGSCALCGECKAKFDEPCPYPGQALTSLESLAVDVLALLDRFGLDNKFHPDRITWTGCILF